MAYTYSAGETKVRPGVYQRTTKTGSTGAAGALVGVVALAMKASWGPIDVVTEHSSVASVKETYGTGTGVDAAIAILNAGASTVYIKRVKGTGETAGTADIESVATLNAKYPGKRTLDVIVRVKAGDATTKQAVVKEGTNILETFDFAVNDADETDAFLKAIENSKYITATKKTAGLIVAGEYKLDGTDSTVTAENYAEAYSALEPYSYNVLVTDSIDTDVFATLCAYEVESYKDGKLIMVVGGSDSSVDLGIRMERAAACNSERVVYFGGSWIDGDGNEVKGVIANAYIAGVIAATPANKSIVHAIISGATDVPEKLTNSQYTEAINNGLLLVSLGYNNQVWIDSGINTLVTPREDQDEGWKKIRRVKTRYELMDRIDRTLAPKVGKINCDTDGVAYIIQSAMGVIKSMIAEKKLTSGNFYEDPQNPHKGDSAWFIIECNDTDSLEKIYLQYQFRYSAN